MSGRRNQHPRLTPSQKRLLAMIASFDRRGATQREIALRLRRTAGRIGGRRR
jgi:hypothetical protein